MSKLSKLFKSWQLIKPGFLRCLQDKVENCLNLNALNMVKIEGDSSMGAAYLSAKFYDAKLEFVEHFDNKKFISQMDHLYVKNLITKQSRQQQTKFPICKEEIICKEV